MFKDDEKDDEVTIIFQLKYFLRLEQRFHIMSFIVCIIK